MQNQNMVKKRSLAIWIKTMKTDDIYNPIEEDVETRFDTLNCELDRPLPKGESKKLIGLMKDETGGKMMAIFAGLRVKTYNLLNR